MTFQPVLPLVALIIVAAALIVLRLITMRRLHLTAGSRWATVWRWCGLTLAVLFILIAAARPGIDHGDREASAAARSGENTNVYFIVDRSADSSIEDYGDGQSRMDGIRADVQALIDRHPQARFAVIAFASRPSLDWPLSDDAWSLEPMVSRLSPYAAEADTSNQVNAAAAANVLRYQLIAAGQQYPQSDSLVYYFGSGAGSSRAPQGEFDLTPGSVDGGSVFGYGRAVNEPGLLRIAEQLGVPYVHRQAGQPIAETGGGAPANEGLTAATGIADRTELYWVFTLLAAVLLLFELYLTLREFRRTRLARRNVTL
jgi:von Willebrand factor type A domain